MKNLSFRNRIATIYIITTALLIGAVFAVIFIVERIAVSEHLDEDLEKEVQRHLSEIEVKDEQIALKRHKEWMEREHNTIGVDPVFIEFVDLNGVSIDKSPNLKNSNLKFDPQKNSNEFYNQELADKRIRQAQESIFDKDGNEKGYLLVAVAREGSEVVLETLGDILLITYPIILFVLFFVARFIVGRSIKPINDIIDTSNKISRENLKTRNPLPHNKDELYILSDTINNLLDRVENTIEREKSFTSYASHEFRTPLAVLKGTLEVLIRKPRQQEEYQEKIKYCIQEIDRLNHLVDELLLLTRYENLRQSLDIVDTDVKLVLDDIIKQHERQIRSKNIEIIVSSSTKQNIIKTDTSLFSTIIDNLLSNAIKYSFQNGKVEIDLKKEPQSYSLIITDYGIGIPKKDFDKVCDKFYRSIDHSDIKGFGLGLSIVKKFTSLLNIDFQIESEQDRGTTVRIVIPPSTNQS